jgi:hypothetical protein
LNPDITSQLTIATAPNRRHLCEWVNYFYLTSLNDKGSGTPMKTRSSTITSPLLQLIHPCPLLEQTACNLHLTAHDNNMPSCLILYSAINHTSAKSLRNILSSDITPMFMSCWLQNRLRHFSTRDILICSRGSAIFDVICDNEYVNFCRLVLLFYMYSKWLFWQKVFDKKFLEQLSELPPRFYSGVE